MCGIAGLIDKKNKTIHLQEKVQQMIDVIKHRGPNDQGIYCFKNVGFGHRRLSILDLSADGHQPMHYLNDRFVITYNGEIYNYLELRQELEALGYPFHSKTDTEVILAAYAAWGQDCVRRFNGMWAFAILDKENHSLFCSRDRFGVKPFYYVDTPEWFAFGSEIRQLLPLLQSVSANKEILVDFVLTGITDHTSETFFKDINKLAASHNLLYSLGTHQWKHQPYYQIAFNSHFSTMSAQDSVDSYKSLLEDAIQLRLRADVTVGTCLSGGLDSSSVASIAAPLYHFAGNKSFSAITAVSEQESNNEADYAKQVVEMHHLNWLPVKPTYTDFLESLSQVVQTQEEPFGSPSINMQYFVMQTAKENGISVLLDGQGGDETLLGYEKYYASYLMTTLRQLGLFSFIRALKSATNNNKKLSLFNACKYLIATSNASIRSKFYRHRHDYLRSPIPDLFHLKAFSQASRDIFQLQRLEIESTNLPVLLRYEDKNSMAHSIETRLPFLDYRVVEAALSLPNQYKIHQGWTKWLLRKGMEKQMPDSIAWRKNKFGFEAPESIWLQRHYQEMETQVLTSQLIIDIAHREELKTRYSQLDLRSQWRLYSIALWEKAFGLTS